MEKFDILSIETELQKDTERAGLIEKAFQKKANILNRVKTILSDDLSDEEKSCLISTLYEPKLKETQKELNAVLLDSIDTGEKSDYLGDREVSHGEISSSHKVTAPSSDSTTTGANVKTPTTMASAETSVTPEPKEEKKAKEEKPVVVEVKVEEDTLPF